jgi:hypothetical protein
MLQYLGSKMKRGNMVFGNNVVFGNIITGMDSGYSI